jgi:hypothetical protein
MGLSPKRGLPRLVFVTVGVFVTLGWFFVTGISAFFVTVAACPRPPAEGRFFGFLEGVSGEGWAAAADVPAQGIAAHGWTGLCLPVARLADDAARRVHASL